MLHFDSKNPLPTKFHALKNELRSNKTINYPYLYIIAEGTNKE